MEKKHVSGRETALIGQIRVFDRIIKRQNCQNAILLLATVQSSANFRGKNKPPQLVQRFPHKIISKQFSAFHFYLHER